jgi:hypothetical protein
MTGKSPKTLSEEAQVAAPETTVTSYKGFDLDWKCRGFAYEVGKTYEHTGKVRACSSGFHACEYPLDVYSYYAPGQSRFATVTQFGDIAKHSDDTKIASAKITIDAEIKIPEIAAAAVKWVIDRCTPADAKHSEGYQSAASSTGYRSAASSTGDRSAASSTGYQSAASSTGYQSAASSTGDRSAASSTGYRSAASSTGDRSAASSTGDRSAASSTGYRSAASSTGYQSAASSTGYRSAASSTGDQSAASSTGDQSAAMSSGLQGRVMGAVGCALFLVYRDEDTCDILHAWAGIVGRDGIKPDVWYSLDAHGKPVEVAA